MRELRNTKIIAVDHGYGNMKTANTVTPPGIKAYETEPIFTGNILEYNGIYYRIGEGHKEFIPDKAMDEEYYLLTLIAIARELNVFSIREADVHLAAGLPLTWSRNQREAFRSYLLQNPEVHYLFNGKEYHLRFVESPRVPSSTAHTIPQSHLADHLICMETDNENISSVVSRIASDLPGLHSLCIETWPWVNNI